ncbi:hypothetical protein ACHWQZ_G008207 [Mnemiopsis leidyi]
MILYFVLLIRLSLQIPRIPADFAKSSVQCELLFDSTVRRVYPEYNLVTGEKFISQINTTTCSVSVTQTHDTSTCTDSSTCTDQATSLVKIDNTTLYYCYSDNSSPKPFTATLLPNNSYEFSSGGKSQICLEDPSKSSFSNLNPDNQLLYMASASFETGLIYYNISSDKIDKPPNPSNRGDEIKEITGLFVRGDFVYTVYLDREVSTITRSCKNDPSVYEGYITTFTVADIHCASSIDGEKIILDRVLSLEYNEDLDKLFILATRRPVSSSMVALCVLDVATDIDYMFDTSLYKGFDESGADTQIKQGEIKCESEKNQAVEPECISTAETTDVAAVLEYTDVFTFTMHKTLDHHLVYFLCDDSIYVYEYFPTTGKTRNLLDIYLWDEGRSISIHQDLIYLTFDNSVHVTEPQWCSFYGRDPVGCIESMYPSCSYSKSQSRCLSTAQCTTSDSCVQDLETGSFSTLFPEGYSYKVKGTECLNNKIFIDTDVNIASNGTVSTVKSYRDCSPEPVVTSGPEPSIETDKMLSNREIGFLAGMACLLALSVFLLTILACKGNNKKKNPKSLTVKNSIAPI